MRQDFDTTRRQLQDDEMVFTKEKRSGLDRRQTDLGPLGAVERRKRAEARKPVIAELELSEDEWKRHFGRYGVVACTTGG